MSIRFDAASQKFILETAHTQYVFQILHDQFPVHLHYGPRVDPETLSYTPREMSFSPYYKEYGMHYLPDTAPAEYSYFGSGKSANSCSGKLDSMERVKGDLKWNKTVRLHFWKKKEIICFLTKIILKLSW